MDEAGNESETNFATISCQNSRFFFSRSSEVLLSRGKLMDFNYFQLGKLLQKNNSTTNRELVELADEGQKLLFTIPWSVAERRHNVE